MNPVYAHLLVNHLPVIGTLFGLLLLGLTLLYRGERGLLRATALVLMVSALGGVAAQVTGEEAEELVEDRPDVPHDVIEAHEDGSKPALVMTLLAAVIGVGLVVWQTRRGSLPAAGLPALALVTLVAFGLMARMGQTGGQIIRPELRAPSAAPVLPAPG